MPRIYRETAACVDRVEFNGVFYRRYPESPRKHLQRYYVRSGGRGFLHRDIWEYHRGPIPAGHQIHHKDGNHLNNSIENLECISRKAHEAAHSKERRIFGRSDEQQAHLARARAKSAAWHSSPEGIEWHRQHGKDAWKGRRSYALICRQCASTFQSLLSTARYCSKSCQNKAWRAAHPEYDAQKRARAKTRRLQLECGGG